jgi:hypothetical protein
MIAEFAAGIAGLKTVADLSTLLLKMNVDSAVTQKAIEANAAVINAQNLMLELQTKYQDLLSQKDALEKRLLQIENWQSEAEKYSLTEIAPGVLAYALKQKHAEGVPSHWLCAHCYGKHQKSILQRGKQTEAGTYYGCTNCRTEIVDHVDALPLVF